MIDFDVGQCYIDFDKSIDKFVVYGIGVLVVGGIVVKVGLFVKFGVMLLVLKKFIVFGIVVVVGLFKKLFCCKQV